MSLFGKDLDEVFAYQTPKIVVLKDRRLGFIALSLKLCIFLYIFVWMILHEGKHLSVADVDGVNRLSLRHPTAHMCDPYHIGCRGNYTPFVDLSYCSQSDLQYGVGENEKRYCSLWDNVEAYLPVDNGILVPTRLLRFDQVRSCEPSPANSWSCDPAPYAYVGDGDSLQTIPGEAKPKFDSFISDIERFAILIDHNFRRAGGMIEDDSQMIGHVMDCPDSNVVSADCKNVAIPCGHDECPPGSDLLEGVAAEPEETPTLLVNFLRGKRRLINGRAKEAAKRPVTDFSGGYTHAAAEYLSQNGTAVALPVGDAFTLGSLLRMANVDLDVKGPTGKAPRIGGVILVLHITYSNSVPGFLGLQVTPWRAPRPFYTYRVTTRDSAEYRLTKTLADPADSKRVVRTYYGVRVVIEQTGRIALWDTAYFLITMTTALGLMAVSNTVTDLMLMYILPQSKEYYKRKFYQSKDFNPEEGQEARAPSTKKEAGEHFLEALEAQDGEAVADALPVVMEFSKK